MHHFFLSWNWCPDAIQWLCWELQPSSRKPLSLPFRLRLWKCYNSSEAFYLFIFLNVFFLPTPLFFLTGCLAKAGWCCELQTLYQATSFGKPVQGSLVGTLSWRLEMIDSVKTKEAELSVSGCLLFGSWAWGFFRVSFFLFLFYFFSPLFCNNSVNMAAKGLIPRLWCSGTTVQWVTIQ